MQSKQAHRDAIKVARQELKDAYHKYRRELKKQRLLRQQAEVKDALAELGVWSKQIPVTVIESKPQKIKVKVNKGVSADELHLLR